MPSRLRRLGRELFTQWPWAVPVVVAAFVYHSQGAYLQRAIAALVAVIIVLVASRRPDRSLLVLIALLPVQALLLAQLYTWGLPAQIVRPLAGWKEALGIGVVIAGVRGFAAAQRRLDRLDKGALAYVAVVAIYAVVPRLFAAGAPTSSSVRSLGFRESAGFVLLLLAARHADLPDDFMRRATNVVLAVGAAVAAIGIYEYVAPGSWNNFVVDHVRYLQYQVQILHSVPSSLTDIRRYGYVGGHKFLRTGSVFLDPTPAGFFMVLPFAIAVERRLHAHTSRAGTALLALFSVALVLTQTRAALVAALVVCVLAARPAAGRTTNRRLQFAFVFAAGLVLLVPAAAASGLSQRVTTTGSVQDQSSSDHVRSFWDGVHAVADRPIGYGLGTSAGIGQRFSKGTVTVPENQYLEVGIETGVLAMALFIGLTVMMLRRLAWASRRVVDIGVTATRSAGVGLAIGACLLPAYNEFAVSWAFWALAGAAIGSASRAQGRKLAPAATSATIPVSVG